MNNHSFSAPFQLHVNSISASFHFYCILLGLTQSHLFSISSLFLSSSSPFSVITNNIMASLITKKFGGLSLINNGAVAADAEDELPQCFDYLNQMKHFFPHEFQDQISQNETFDKAHSILSCNHPEFQQMTSETFRRKYKQFYLLGPNGKKHPRWANDDISHIIATSRGGAQCLENVFMFNFQFNRAIGAIQAVGDPINCALVGLERAKRAVKASREHGDYMGADGEYLHMMGMELLGHMGIKAKKDGGIDKRCRAVRNRDLVLNKDGNIRKRKDPYMNQRRVLDAAKKAGQYTGDPDLEELDDESSAYEGFERHLSKREAALLSSGDSTQRGRIMLKTVGIDYDCFLQTETHLAKVRRSAAAAEKQRLHLEGFQAEYAAQHLNRSYTEPPQGEDCYCCGRPGNQRTWMPCAICGKSDD